MVEQTKTKIEEVEMTLAEAVEMHELGWRQKLDYRNRLRPYNLFSEVFQFRPHSFNELVSQPTQKNGNNTNGRLFLARKRHGKIEIVPARLMTDMHKAETWKRRKDFFQSRLFSNYTDGGIGGENGNYAHVFYTVLNDLSPDLFVPCSLDSVKTIANDGTATIDEIGSLPLFEKGDYERFWRDNYPGGIEEVEQRGGRIKVIEPQTLSWGWNFVIPALASNHLFYRAIPRKKESASYDPCNLNLSGTFSSLGERDLDDPVFREYWQHATPRGSTLDGELLQAYASPKDLGNGILAMSLDRIPKYLKRRLGFGGTR
jgi:hypothetical protein